MGVPCRCKDDGEREDRHKPGFGCHGLRQHIRLWEGRPVGGPAAFRRGAGG